MESHDDRLVRAAASCAQINDANRPDRQADASASMLRRARLRTIPGDSPNSAAVSANTDADINPCPLRQTVRTPNRSVCSTSEESRRRSPDPIKPTCSPQDRTSLSSSLGETSSCSCCSGNLSVGTVRRSAHDGRFSAPSRARTDRMFASTLPATFWCRHQGNCRISSQSWLATSASVSGTAGACRATAIAPGSNAHATTHAADRQSLPEGELIWTSACSTSSAASMPTNISQSRSPSTLAPTLAVCPAQPNLVTAAAPLPIPAPGPPHRVVPRRSTFLLPPHVAPKVAELRHPNRAPKIDLLGVRPGCKDITPAISHTPGKPRTSRPPWVIAASFRE